MNIALGLALGAALGNPALALAPSFSPPSPPSPPTPPAPLEKPKARR